MAWELHERSQKRFIISNICIEHTYSGLLFKDLDGSSSSGWTIPSKLISLEVDHNFEKHGLVCVLRINTEVPTYFGLYVEDGLLVLTKGNKKSVWSHYSFVPENVHAAYLHQLIFESRENRIMFKFRENVKQIVNKLKVFHDTIQNIGGIVSFRNQLGESGIEIIVDFDYDNWGEIK